MGEENKWDEQKINKNTRCVTYRDSETTGETGTGGAPRKNGKSHVTPRAPRAYIRLPCIFQLGTPSRISYPITYLVQQQQQQQWPSYYCHLLSIVTSSLIRVEQSFPSLGGESQVPRVLCLVPPARLSLKKTPIRK